MKRSRFFVLELLILFCASSYAEPVVLNGEMFPSLLGEPLKSLRVLNLQGKAIPFQIDEMTSQGEYVLTEGEMPNADSGSGVLGLRDEIVFLWEDADTISGEPHVPEHKGELVILTQGKRRRAVLVGADPGVQLSPKSYIEYDHLKQHLRTPFYFATFRKDRFHFISAGVKDFKTGNYVKLTNELRIEILLKALWGLVPVRYSEENVVCLVRRYKCGPVRLIRRGDFHLNLGMGVKGSRAAVNQICYPQIVKVPVYLHLPFRFRTLFSQAFVEMTPVLRAEGSSFQLSVPSEKFRMSLSHADCDSLELSVPDGKLFTVHDGTKGYGWLLQTSMKHSFLDGSGFVFRKPSSRSGLAECGYRLTIKDVPKGFYHITNWVLFSDGSHTNLLRDARSLVSPASVMVGGKTYACRLGAVHTASTLEK